MLLFKPPKKRFEHVWLLAKQLFQRVIGSDYEDIIVRRQSGSFSLSNKGNPRVCPLLEVRAETSRVTLIELIENDNLLAFIAIPPLVLHLPIDGRRFSLLRSLPRLPSTRLTPIPEALSGHSANRSLHVVLGNGGKRLIVPNIYIGRDFFKPIRLGELFNLTPVCRVIPLQWLLTKLPGTIKSCFFLKAIRRSTIIFSHRSVRSKRVNLNEGSLPQRIFAGEVELQMRSPRLTCLKLSIKIDSFNSIEEVL